MVRDVLTVQTSALAAVFARQFEARMRPQIRRNKQRRLRLKHDSLPSFNSLRQEPRQGRLMSDDEIFDFTDSRFLHPPAENIRNYPHVALISLGGQTYVTPAPVQLSPSTPAETVTHRSSLLHPRRPTPTPQPIFKLPEPELHLPGLKHHVVQSLPEKEPPLEVTKHVVHSLPEVRHKVVHSPASEESQPPHFRTIRPFVNLGSSNHLLHHTTSTPQFSHQHQIVKQLPSKKHLSKIRTLKPFYRQKYRPKVS